MKIALVKEGFELSNAERDVNDKVRAAAKRFEQLGATVTEVSIPMHQAGGAIWVPIGVEGLTQTMMWGDGYGVSRQDLYVTSLMDYHRSWRSRADELSETTKLFALLGTYIKKQHGGHYYGKAMNVCRRLTAAYDAALAEHDLLMMPTTPIKASQLPGPNASREEVVEKALNMIGNTSPFDITHHPAMAIPCAMSEGLPVSVMLVGKHFDEPTIYRAAFAFERAGDWKRCRTLGCNPRADRDPPFDAGFGVAGPSTLDPEQSTSTQDWPNQSLGDRASAASIAPRVI